MRSHEVWGMWADTEDESDSDDARALAELSGAVAGTRGDDDTDAR
jgi:hypothetical protein